MRRADVLGIMAAQLAAAEQWRGRGEQLASFYYVNAADTLLREAERVSPEPERVQYYGPLDAKPPFANITVAPPQRPDPIHVPEKPR